MVRFSRRVALALAVLVSISIVIGLSLAGLLTLNLLLQIMPVIVGLLISILIEFGMYAVTERLGKKVAEADAEELKREDDVFLQGVAFSQTVLFFLVNLVVTEIGLRTLLGGMIAIFAVSFYVLRAVSKVKNNSRFRYYSMFFFSLVVSDTVVSTFASIAFLLSKEWINSEINWISVIIVFMSIATSFRELVQKIFKKRYGIE